MKKRIAVLGATGSIGMSALDVLSRDKENFEIVLLSAHSKYRELLNLKTKWPRAVCVLTGEKNGQEKLLQEIKNTSPDITVNGITGAAGLEPSLASIEAGSNLALANKESIVMAGELVLRKAEEKKVNIIPVDSEHSAIFHLMKTNDKISEIILTASGGPFKDLSLQEMENVTVEQALAHPTWKMGRKITIDSASMANKGLEIIEACILFKQHPDNINVVIHPQSIVHSMIRLCNGTLYAQLSKPDMRHPIHDALYWPKVMPSEFEQLNFDSLTLEFYKSDPHKFPMLNLAWEAAKLKQVYPCAYNAANEEAVSAFLQQKIKFTDIAKVTACVLEKDWTCTSMELDAVLTADKEARLKAIRLINEI